MQVVETLTSTEVRFRKDRLVIAGWNVALVLSYIAFLVPFALFRLWFMMNSSSHAISEKIILLYVISLVFHYFVFDDFR